MGWQSTMKCESLPRLVAEIQQIAENRQLLFVLFGGLIIKCYFCSQ